MIGCEFHSGQSEGGLVTISSLSTEGEERKKRIKTSTTIPFLDRWNSAPLAVPRISNSLDWKFNRVRVYPRPRYRAVTIERLPVIGRNEVTLPRPHLKMIFPGEGNYARTGRLARHDKEHEGPSNSGCKRGRGGRVWSRFPPERIRYLQAQLNTMTRGH